MSEKELLAQLLTELGKKIRTMDEADYAAVLDGRGRLRLVFEASTKPTRDANPEDGEESQNAVDAPAVIAALRLLESLDSGAELLERDYPAKAQLLQICRFLDLPADKKDSASRLRQRIVEATIGFRLRSDAIQNVRP